MTPSNSHYKLFFRVTAAIVLLRIVCNTFIINKNSFLIYPYMLSSNYTGVIFLGINLLYFLYSVHTKQLIDKTKLNFVFLTFGISLLVFDDIVIRLLGSLIIFYFIIKLTKSKGESIF